MTAEQSILQGTIGAGRAKIVVMLHPEDGEGAAERKVAAMTGIGALGGGAKVGKLLCNAV